jgi:putative tryptophan/tyrosine transport system substrate-binding protein
MEAKRFGLLHELVPTVTTLGVLMNPKTAEAETQLSDVQAAGRTLQQRIEVVNASNEIEIDAAFAALAQSKIGAVLVGADPFFNNRRDLIVSLAARYAIPAIYPLRDLPIPAVSSVMGPALQTHIVKSPSTLGVFLRARSPAKFQSYNPQNLNW